ncbi:MAG: response regulator [Devosia sp.]
MSPRLFVAVVDDDQSVRESLPGLLRVLDVDVEAFATAEMYLACGRIEATRCLILDVAMPGMSGPDLHQELVRRGYAIPVIFITGHVDLKDSSKLLRPGVVDFLLKPFSEDDIFKALRNALSVNSSM